MKKILIANRGEIACRVIRSCHALGLAAVAVYSEADASALHVRMADGCYGIGASPARESYLVADRILEACAATGADGVHPGYGFLSENAEFAARIEAAGLRWIGPSPDTIRLMGDKERAREIARAAGVPVLAGSRRFPEGDLDGLAGAATEVGFPLLVKASGGGGGIGMRRVDSLDLVEETVRATQSAARKSFGDGTIYLERFVPTARHVEVQVFGFGNGDAVHFHERDCSLQRRFQKVVEETPAPGLPPAMRAAMADAAVRLCRAQRYSGAGTIEFVVDTDSQSFHFLEMNTRIQVEHAVTEMACDVDLVAMQINLARGALQSFPQSNVSAHGAAVECRLYAENPARHFLPSPGRLEHFRLPEPKADVRIDTGFVEGDTITTFYDPMIAKVICHGETRPEALDAMSLTLEAIDIAGVKSNLEFLKQVVRHHAFVAGEVFTGFLDRYRGELIPR